MLLGLLTKQWWKRVALGRLTSCFEHYYQIWFRTWIHEDIGSLRLSWGGKSNDDGFLSFIGYIGEKKVCLWMSVNYMGKNFM